MPGAIQTDVQKDAKDIVDDTQIVDNGNTERQLSARELAMEQITASRNQAFEEESGLKLETPEAAAKVDDDGDAGEEEADQLAIQQAAAAAAEQAPTDILKQKVKIKVNGVESETTVEEMQRVYQKDVAADRRLQEAARRERELNDREADFQAQVEAAKKQPAPALDAESTKEFTAAMFGGDEEKAAAAFEAAVTKAVDGRLAGRKEATPIDIDQITATVEQRFAVNNALKKSQADYPDLYSDPDMEDLAAAKIRRKQADDGMSFAEALESTGSEMATKFGWKTPGHPVKTDSTVRDSKLARKEALDPVVGIGVKTSTQEEAPLSNSQVIAEMAKRRGQSV